MFVSAAPTAKARKKLRFGFSWVAAALVLGLIIAGVAAWFLKPSELPRIVSFDYDLPEGQELNIVTAMPGHTLAVSPDGRQFIYSTSQGLYLRSEEELEARLIPGTDDNPQSPFFSHDGQSVGYWSQADSKLKTIPIGGGAPVPLCDVTWLWGADWHSDNTIVYADVLSGIKRISANGGTPETLVEGVCIAPQFLPDGESVIYMEGPTQPYRIVAQSLESGERKELFAGEFARYLPTGHLVYTFESNLYAVPFDPVTLEETGGRATIVEGVYIFYAISNTGTLVYLPGTTGSPGGAPLPQRTLVWVDHEGNEEPLNTTPNVYNSFRISPDGTKVALDIGPEGNTDIWIWDLVRKTILKLTFDEADDGDPLWTPDGQRIVFHSLREGGLGGIYSKSANFTGGVDRLVSEQNRLIFPISWSGDGNTLVLQEVALNPLSTDIGVLPMEGDRERKSLLQEKHNEVHPQVSPDGRWMAYQSDETGQSEIYVRPFPDVESGGQRLISNSGGNSPLWSPDGRELFYRNGDTTIAVPVETDPTFNPGNPRVLFQAEYFSESLPLGEYTPWDIHPDDGRFLMIKAPQTSAGIPASTNPRQINIVLNWFEELKKRVPIE
jgi:Tol biopolymer transport system component